MWPRRSKKLQLTSGDRKSTHSPTIWTPERKQQVEIAALHFILIPTNRSGLTTLSSSFYVSVQKKSIHINTH